ncbi:hypothetical protein CBD41_10150 [bacterium TMED181]|nr:MAG: hypothetical protein CBD41_10150 [bacterium TMED181]
MIWVSCLDDLLLTAPPMSAAVDRVFVNSFKQEKGAGASPAPSLFVAGVGFSTLVHLYEVIAE